MKTTKYIILVIAILLLSMVSFATAKVEISATHDSYMRPYLETTFGNVPSAGHYTHWTVFVESDTYGWVSVGFDFNNRKEIVKVYLIPYNKAHVTSDGYMKTFTNKVNVTIEPPYI